MVERKRESEKGVWGFLIVEREGGTKGSGYFYASRMRERESEKHIAIHNHSLREEERV